MRKNLTEAFNASKKTRNVLSKIIIFESGVSKSQFYRIIKGQEAPSPETKKLLSISLGIDGEEFDQLYQQSKAEPEMPSPAVKPKRFGLFAVLAVSLFLMAAVFLTLNNLAHAPEPREPVLSKSVVEADDRTQFIEDVTIPDGTIIAVNTEYVKTWRVKNVGSVAWKDRYLMRTTPASPLLCSSPTMVPIPETLPGETVDISVRFRTPHLPGSCRTDWKSADDRGNLHFPDKHGLFSIVVVTE